MLAYLAPLTRELFIFVIIADFKAHSNDKEQVRLIASRLARGYPPCPQNEKVNRTRNEKMLGRGPNNVNTEQTGPAEYKQPRRQAWCAVTRATHAKRLSCF